MMNNILHHDNPFNVLFKTHHSSNLDFLMRQSSLAIQNYLGQYANNFFYFDMQVTMDELKFILPCKS